MSPSSRCPGSVCSSTADSAEKLLRDSLVLPIYEGTSQIQSLMAMKDTLGNILKRPQEFVRRIAQARWDSTAKRDPLERRNLALEREKHGDLLEAMNTKLNALIAKEVGEDAGQMLPDGVDGGWVATGAVNDV